MHRNQAYTEGVTQNKRTCNWWHQRQLKIICISFIILTISAVTLSLVLKFIILAPEKPGTSTLTLTLTTTTSVLTFPTTTPSPATSIPTFSTTTTSTVTSSSVVIITTPQTTTSESITTMDTTQQSTSPTPVDGICANATWARNGQTVAGGNGRGSELNQFAFPFGLFVDNNQAIYVVDEKNDRVVKWDRGASSGQLVAGGNGEGGNNDQLYGPTDVVVDKNGIMYISDTANARIQRVTGDDRSGETIIEEPFAFGIALDEQGSIYVSGALIHEVRKWRVGETVGQLITSNLSFPSLLFVDRNRSVYIADTNNNRIVKVDDGATQISIVATGHFGNGTDKIENPSSVIVDDLGTVYLSQSGSNNVIRWPRGSTSASVIAGGRGPGSQSDQLFTPTDLAFDSDGNLYVVDSYNHRVQKYSIDKSMC